MTAPVLALRDVRRFFGGTAAVNGVTLDLQSASLTGVIGPNGAGKTTLVNIAGGQLAPTSGSVLIRGMDVTRAPSHRRFELGLARTFQSLRLYAGLSCYENLCAGQLTPSARLADVQVVARGLIRSLALDEYATQVPGNLPFGKQKLVAIGRVLVAEPSIVLMDEPFAGLTEEEIVSLSGVLEGLVAGGAAILVIEHNIDALARIARDMVVLDNGEVIAVGAPAAVLELDRVRLAYFGGHRRKEVAAAIESGMV